MHRGHDHNHLNESGGGATRPGPGHNSAGDARLPVQWQSLHGDAQHTGHKEGSDSDIDLVAAAFVEGFIAASDPTSFLRLAKVPFDATDADGTKLSLLRVEIDAITDVGAITPHLGGTSFRYDPLPARMVSRRRQLRFVYFDGQKLRPLDLAGAMALST